jgi:hypothetical protein
VVAELTVAIDPAFMVSLVSGCGGIAVIMHRTILHLHRQHLVDTPSRSATSKRRPKASTASPVTTVVYDRLTKTGIGPR